MIGGVYLKEGYVKTSAGPDAQFVLGWNFYCSSFIYRSGNGAEFSL